jgi:DNA-binding transcriptional regulator YhcF (GntR family)
MKYVLCQTIKEAEALAEEVNRERGYPFIHELGVDAVIQNPGRAYERMSALGAIKTYGNTVATISAQDEPVVLLSEAEQMPAAVSGFIVSEGTIEIKTREAVPVIIEEVPEEVIP